MRYSTAEIERIKEQNPILDVLRWNAVGMTNAVETKIASVAPEYVILADS